MIAVSSDTCIQETFSLAKHSAECGADDVVVAPSFYFPITQAELLCYVEHVVHRVSLPVFLYNMPALTKITFAIDTLETTTFNQQQAKLVASKE